MFCLLGIQKYFFFSKQQYQILEKIKKIKLIYLKLNVEITVFITTNL